jgi:hypothetical protein
MLHVGRIAMVAWAAAVAAVALLRIAPAQR